jgi:hypothetical protein
MSKEFNNAKEKLLSDGYNIADSEYHRESFGSWYITLDTLPKRRLVWDGRDYLLRVDEETREVVHGVNAWKDIWVSKRIETSELDDLIKEVLHTKYVNPE